MITKKGDFKVKFNLVSLQFHYESTRSQIFLYDFWLHYEIQTSVRFKGT